VGYINRLNLNVVYHPTILSLHDFSVSGATSCSFTKVADGAKSS